MADYIHVRNSDARVMAVYTTTQTPASGQTEYFESHPVFNPLWDIAAWTRTGVGAYTGAPIDNPQAAVEKFTVKNTSADTTPSYLSIKLVEGSAIDLTTLSPGGNETLRIDVDINELTEDTTPDTAADFVLTYDVSATANKKVKLTNLGTGTGFTNYQQNESDGESTTTSSTLQTKLTLTTSSLTSGNYQLEWYYELTTASVSTFATGEVSDGTTIFGTVVDQTSTDTAGAYDKSVSGWKYLPSISGVKNFTIKYRLSVGSGTAKIRRARLNIWRIS